MLSNFMPNTKDIKKFDFIKCNNCGKKTGFTQVKN